MWYYIHIIKNNNMKGGIKVLIKIREQVFETNSSSAHSVFIHGKISSEHNYLDIMQKVDWLGELEVELGEFGWGIDYYTDALTKLQYALTMVYETEIDNDIKNLTWTWSDLDELESYKNKTEKAFYETEGYKEIADLLRRTCGVEKLTVYNFDGYIDHQSCEDYHSLNDFLNDWNVSLEDFIFSENITLKISNDNI